MAAVQPILVPDLYQGFLVWRSFIAKTTSYTLVPSDNGSLFTNVGASGSVTFTLPTLSQNYRFGFLVVADQTVTITAPAANTVVAFNNATATSLAFSTASHRIGGCLVLQSNELGTLWYSFCVSADPSQNTITVS
jgi:hypothetical protein